MLGFVHPMVSIGSSIAMVKLIFARLPVCSLLRGRLSFFLDEIKLATE